VRRLTTRARWLLAGLLGTFLVVRAVLHLAPNTDVNVGAYNVHHLFTGVLIASICGVPLVLGRGSGRAGDRLALGFGAGLALALDEWVYLIVTDGSNASYLLPASLIGGVIFVAVAAGYVAWLGRSGPDSESAP
jgi:hypothetical protein